MKEYEAETNVNVYILLDASGSMARDDRLPQEPETPFPDRRLEQTPVKLVDRFFFTPRSGEGDPVVDPEILSQSNDFSVTPIC